MDPEAVRSAALRHLNEVQERCARRLLTLSREMGHLRDEAHHGSLGEQENRLAEGLRLALRRFQEIVDEAHQGILELPVGSDAAPSDRAAQPGPESVAEDAALAWVSEVQGAVPLPVLAQLLKVLRDEPRFNRIAQARPQLMSQLLVTMEPADAATWLPSWERAAAAEALSSMSARQAARCLEPMDADVTLGLLAEMSRGNAADVLAAAGRERAARLLVGMDRTDATRLLEQMEPEVVADCLLHMERLDLAAITEFTRLMSAGLATECLEAMDSRRAERNQAKQLLDRSKSNPQDPSARH